MFRVGRNSEFYPRVAIIWKETLLPFVKVLPTFLITVWLSIYFDYRKSVSDATSGRKIDYSINTIQNIINMRVNDSFKTEANLLYFAINSAKHAN